jgi:ribosomal protein S9
MENTPGLEIFQAVGRRKKSVVRLTLISGKFQNEKNRIIVNNQEVSNLPV